MPCKPKSRSFLLVMALALLPKLAVAAGIIIIDPWIPPWPPVPPMPMPEPIPVQQPIKIRSQNVTVRLRDGAATTTVEQVFYNPNDSQLEGTYLFPLGEDAAVHDFSAWMNGKEMQGELLEADKARQVYEDIVRRMRDPALLEYADRGLFKCRVFPIPANGEFKVRLTWTRPLAMDTGQIEYIYPLRTQGGHADLQQEKISVTIDAELQREIRSVTCPTHDLAVERIDSKHVKLSWQASDIQPERDLAVLLDISTKDVGLSLMAFNPPDEDGYFMAVLSPKEATEAEEIVGKDIVFVLDRSGSMLDGDKIGAARRALSFCLRSLRPEDRFGIVPFSTEAETWRDGLADASAENVAAAVRYVEEIRARGGTAIDDALQAALKLDPQSERPFMVVFLTDGEPTIGERDPVKILEHVKAEAPEQLRLFVFGVGYDINVTLLEDLARQNGGSTTFVTPKEDLEVKLGSFYTRVASPALTDVEIEFVGLETSDVYPKQPGDLFHGQPLTLVGRYTGSGQRAVRLTGKLAGQTREVVYEVDFPSEATEHDYVPRIWALRKIGWLLDEIRRGGESDEVKQEIVRLSKRHGIMTPYTSWLVIEDAPVVANGDPIPQPEPFFGAVRESLDQERTEEVAAKARAFTEPAAPTSAAVEAQQFSQDLMGAGSARALTGGTGGAPRPGAGNAPPPARAGEGALRADGTYRLEDAEGRDLARSVGGKTFYRQGEVWIDSAYVSGTPTNKIAYLSDGYFELLRASPELGQYLALGERVIVVHQGTAYEVTAE